MQNHHLTSVSTLPQFFARQFFLACRTPFGPQCKLHNNLYTEILFSLLLHALIQRSIHCVCTVSLYAVHQQQPPHDLLLINCIRSVFNFLLQSLLNSNINIYMVYTWLVTVQFNSTDAFKYAQLGKVQYTRVELNYMGFKVYTVEEFNSFIAEHHRASMITLARLQLDFIARPIR